MKKWILSFLIVMIFTFFTLYSKGLWTIVSKNVLIEFSLMNQGKAVKGNINNLQGNIAFDGNDLINDSIHVKVNVANITTGVKERDDHLLSKDFFDVADYPVIEFTSAEISKSGTDFLVAGDLKIKNIIQKSSIRFTFSDQDSTGVFDGVLTIDRYKFGIGETGDGIGNIITIHIIVPVKK